MYSARMFLNLSHRDNDSMIAIMADRDETPRLSGGPSGWKGLIASVTEFQKLKTNQTILKKNNQEKTYLPTSPMFWLFDHSY